jgi:putative DNA primase/helicase
LAPHNPDQELVLAEGVETTLSAMELFDLPGWSAVSAGGLRTIELPPEVRRILIAVDHDDNGCSQRNSVEAAQRWEAEGRAVHSRLPKISGADFNDVLINRGQA